MRKIMLCITLLLILCTLCACLSQQSSKTGKNLDVSKNIGSQSNVAPDKTFTDNATAIQQPKTSTDIQSNAQSSPKNPNADTNKSKGFYGIWKISKTYDTGTVSALTADDINSIIGKKITYSQHSAAIEKNICNTPVYKRNIYSKEDFIFNTKTTLDKIGIEANSVTGIDIYENNGEKNLWNSIGNSFFIKNDNTLILSYEGMYFELDRVE
ncbi:MAG: hypothetical protein Q8865_08900 [Bacillota bacterium]|nr:hypothetical protein [Bacillota bacterium]